MSQIPMLVLEAIEIFGKRIGLEYQRLLAVQQESHRVRSSRSVTDLAIPWAIKGNDLSQISINKIK